MGYAERDWYREEDRSEASWGGLPFPWGIIVLAATAFLVSRGVANGNAAAGLWIEEHLVLSADGLLAGKVWQLLTHAFLHRGIGSLFFDVVGLWVFARILEDLQPARVLRLFFLGGIVIGGIGAVAGALAVQRPGYPVGGFTGGEMLLLGYGVARIPKAQMVLILIPVPLWVVGVAYALIPVLDAIGTPYLPVLAGWITLPALAGLGMGLRDRGRPAPGSACRICGKPLARVGGRLECPACGVEPEPLEPPAAPAGPSPAEIEARVDRLLARIHEEGIGSLSDEERDFLKRASERYRGGKG